MASLLGSLCHGFSVSFCLLGVKCVGGWFLCFCPAMPVSHAVVGFYLIFVRPVCAHDFSAAKFLRGGGEGFSLGVCFLCPCA